MLGVAALLGALVNNGGPTLAHALLAGSPALDSADPTNFPFTDQRGMFRPQNSVPDIGAFELFLSPVPPTLQIGPGSPRTVIVSWTPSTPGFMLQINSSHDPLTWTNAPRGGANPISLPVENSEQFFRLRL